VSFSTGIELKTGPSRGLRLAELLLGVLALCALLTSPADPQWVALASLVLVVTFFALGRFPRKADGAGSLVLFTDGSAAIRTGRGIVHGRRCHGSWSSRLCSVLVLQVLPGERRMRFLVCRARNGADDYRRLLVYLRVADPEGNDRVERWL
jgi:hypothetical protein